MTDTLNAVTLDMNAFEAAEAAYERKDIWDMWDGENDTHHLVKTVAIAAAIEAYIQHAPSEITDNRLDPRALKALKENQRQLDEDGVEVGVSRQAVDEVVAYVESTMRESGEEVFKEAYLSMLRALQNVLDTEDNKAAHPQGIKQARAEALYNARAHIKETAKKVAEVCRT